MSKGGPGGAPLPSGSGFLGTRPSITGRIARFCAIVIQSGTDEIVSISMVHGDFAEAKDDRGL
jgi:hypothetical protein